MKVLALTLAIYALGQKSFYSGNISKACELIGEVGALSSLHCVRMGKIL